MRHQDEPDPKNDEPELDDDILDDEMDEDEEDTAVMPQRGEIERGAKSRAGDAGEVGDRVAWRDDDDDEPEDDDAR